MWSYVVTELVLREGRYLGSSQAGVCQCGGASGRGK